MLKIKFDKKNNNKGKNKMYMYVLFMLIIPILRDFFHFSRPFI